MKMKHFSLNKQRIKHTKLLKRERRIGFVFSLPAILGMVIFFLIPFVITIFYSLSRGGRFVGFSNYSSVIKSEAFRIATGNTLKFNGIAVPIIMIISLGIALLLFKKLKGSDFFRATFIFPLVNK